MRRSRIPLLFINSQLMLEDKYLNVYSYGEEVSYKANCNEKQIKNDLRFTLVDATEAAGHK